MHAAVLYLSIWINQPAAGDSNLRIHLEAFYYIIQPFFLFKEDIIIQQNKKITCCLFHAQIGCSSISAGFAGLEKNTIGPGTEGFQALGNI
jgi:hypothetical protein